MTTKLWHTAWLRNPLGFQLNNEGQRIIVLMCGDTVDLKSCFDISCTVVGIEQNEFIIKEFSEEYGWPYTMKEIKRRSFTYKIYTFGSNLKIFQADFMKLDAASLGGTFDFIWDRGVFNSMRISHKQKYVNHIFSLSKHSTRGLIYCSEYNSSQQQTDPVLPFSQMQKLFAGKFECEEALRMQEKAGEESKVEVNAGVDKISVLYLIKQVSAKNVTHSGVPADRCHCCML